MDSRGAAKKGEEEKGKERRVAGLEQEVMSKGVFGHQRPLLASSRTIVRFRPILARRSVENRLSVKIGLIPCMLPFLIDQRAIRKLVGHFI